MLQKDAHYEEQWINAIVETFTVSLVDPHNASAQYSKLVIGIHVAKNIVIAHIL